MIVAFDPKENVWLAAGKGIIRPILTEGETREKAIAGWRESFSAQKSEEYEMAEVMSALGDIDSGEYGIKSYGEKHGE